MNATTSDIRLLSVESITDFADIAINAYPGFKIATEEARQQLIERLVNVQTTVPIRHLYGLYRDDNLLGGMQLYDFKMNMLGAQIAVGGVGMVAVDLLHKKEHVAKELLTFFLKYYREQGAAMALLYPFRPDFYYAMHFGYGLKINQYRLRPDALRTGNKSKVRFLTLEDKDRVMDCYNRYQVSTHGMIVRHSLEWDHILKNLGLEKRLVGCVHEGLVTGYMLFGFKARAAESPLHNDIVIHEFVYTSREALAALLGFLHRQTDQVDRIVLTTHDTAFHHLLLDPRNECETLIPSVYHESNVQGVGLMYRIINVPGLFAALSAHDFNEQTCRLKITVHDTFFPENAGSTLVYFEHGQATLPPKGNYDVEIMLNVAELSSLLIGVIDFTQLYAYNLAEISDTTYLQTVTRLFSVERPPVCLTAF